MWRRVGELPPCPATWGRWSRGRAATLLAGAVASADQQLGQAGLMRRRPARLPAPRSGFAGLRFPLGVIVPAVRWYLPAPRGASSYPQFSWEELEGRFLGPMAYLDAKARGNSSLPEKQRSCSGV